MLKVVCRGDNVCDHFPSMMRLAYSRLARYKTSKVLRQSSVITTSNASACSNYNNIVLRHCEYGADTIRHAETSIIMLVGGNMHTIRRPLPIT
jgi:hypothetical protein